MHVASIGLFYKLGKSRMLCLRERNRLRAVRMNLVNLLTVALPCLTFCLASASSSYKEQVQKGKQVITKRAESRGLEANIVPELLTSRRP
jgi:hypothetical protein